MSSCAASCFMSCLAASFASDTSDSSPTAGEVLRSNVAALCSARAPASIRPIRLACAVQHAPASCSSSNGSPALSFTSGRASSRPSQGGAALTAHDRLTALKLDAVVFAHAMPDCALAAATNHAGRICKSRLSLASHKSPSVQPDSFTAPSQQPTKAPLPPIEIP